MKVFLMHRDRDVDLQEPLPPNEDALTQDLELTTLLEAMAGADQFLFDVARKTVLASLVDPRAISYRQQVLADCLEHPAVVRELYTIAVDAIVGEKKASWIGLSKWSSPITILSRSVQVLEFFVGVLRRLRGIADGFRSEGFQRFFAMLTSELDDAYFQTLKEHLRVLKFRGGVLISAELGRGNKGTRYVLRRPPEEGNLIQRISAWSRWSSYSFQIPDRDESGARALDDLHGQGINLVADALARSTDHILSFFTMLRSELAFYIGCLNLHERLADKGEPTCLPEPIPPGEPRLAVEGLYDVCLTLHLDARAVGNDVHADGKRLVMITGANQGGKSTFLRSVGLAQLMLQCGMFAPATRFRADVRDGLFTHYKREEDATMESGKLDEELGRMRAIAEAITPGSIVLCNESFASTNEREGSEIARQVLRALLEAGVKVLFVTHLFDLARGFHRQRLDTALFLRAERRPDGTRTFRLLEGEPLPTSYGEDLYRHLFGTRPPAAAAARSDTGG
jgi:DNA mismatch repair ATPase MutS